ncbi:FYVE zinc finger-domain-containing protein [Phellopilus nigrolimitatus]|nr:FYVE zinc finger-domain-containing protein [Phellopilus nigrolimitatus]
MSTTSYVPYQAYKSKRHSRVVCHSVPPHQPRHHPTPSLDTSRKADEVTDASSDVASQQSYNPSLNSILARPRRTSAVSAFSQETPLLEVLPSVEASYMSEPTRPSSAGAQSTASTTAGATLNGDASEPSSPTNNHPTPVLSTTSPPTVSNETLSSSSSASSEAGPSTSKPASRTRKTSTFRYVPLRPVSSSTPRTSSPLASTQARVLSATLPPPSPLSSSQRFDQVPASSHANSASVTPAFATPPVQSVTPSYVGTETPIPRAVISNSHLRSASTTPPQRTSSLPPPPPPKPISPSPTPSSVSSPRTTPSTSTVYRPGFQPKGQAREIGRVERTRLERRFEKLVDLHFSDSTESQANGNSMKGKEKPPLSRRASSLFELDFNDLRTKSASELWRGVLESRAAAANGGKGVIRVAEQRITPWQDDAEVSACPHCSASFHPLTNRKHHCRLCGRIICSLPVKNPQRPVSCSLLFMADPKSGRIQEVSETVDYGVRPRNRVNSLGDKGKNEGADEKFLSGVRICRECKPRQQYRQEAKRVPAMVRLYEALIALESEIEEALPQFQELMISLSNGTDEKPTKEATAARKQLLQCFSDYDVIAKRIRKVPCPNGPGSSQERVQAAILARANAFLQKNMFPLQSLPKLKKRTSSISGANGAKGSALPGDTQVIDPDSELALALQPLLEQEALLESFVEEAKAHRKFEDAKTLKANLGEIRAEIDRVVARADSGTIERLS